MRLSLCHCGVQLTGRQKQHCSDRCRKRASRKPGRTRTEIDQNSTGNTENFEPVQLFAQFTRTLSHLNSKQFEAFQRQLAISLTAAVEYEEVWQSRCLAHQDKFASDKAEAHQNVSELLQNILDFISELRST